MNQSASERYTFGQSQKNFFIRNFYRQHLRNFYRISFKIWDFGRFLGEFSRFWHANMRPVEISTGPKFLKIEKYGVSASFCTLNQCHNSKTRKSRVGQSWSIFQKNKSQILDFESLEFWYLKSQIHQLWPTRDLRVLELWHWFKVQNEAETPCFSIFKNLGSVEISTGLIFACQNRKIRLKNGQNLRFWS